MLLASLGLAPLGGCGGMTLPSASGGSAGQETGGTQVQGGGGQGGSAGTSGAYGTGGIYGTGGSLENRFPCVNPTPLVNAPSGYFHCASGYVHRAEKLDCPARSRSSFDAGSADASSTVIGECRGDADCTASARGYCIPASGSGSLAPGSTYCLYGCVRDQDCATGQICLCGDPVGQCVQAACTADSSCSAGELCASYVANPGCGGMAFACQTPQDQCGGDGDCPSGISCFVQSGARICTPPRCVIGRPFLIDGLARVADTDQGGDWSTPVLAPRTETLPHDVCARLGKAWTKIALLEHASIAAFARFTLQLLSLGAPADLVERSQSAMADETAHAKLAFSLAGAFGGHSVGPSVLDVRGALDQSSLPEILAMVIREGCIGETIAAIEAAEALEYATDPAVRQVLARIARDEARHAELAFRFVRWAVDSEGERVRELAWREFRSALAEEPEPKGLPISSGEDLELMAGGIVPEGLRSVIRAEALRTVVLRCADALLGGIAARSPAAA